MIQTRSEFRFDNPVLEPNRDEPAAQQKALDPGNKRLGLFSTYWQRALGALSILVNALIASRNTGLTAAIATGATVSHGMAQAPKFVTLAPQDATPTAYFADTITTTTFKVHYTGGGTHIFGWSAET